MRYTINAVLILFLSVSAYSQFTSFLPKTQITTVTNYARTNYDANATLYAITSAYGLDTTGKAMAWMYWFYKPNINDSGYVVTTTIFFGNPVMLGFMTPNMPGVFLRALGSSFCESNQSISAAENAGGRQFRQSHPATRISAVVYKIPGAPDTSKPYWAFTYTDTTNAQFAIYFVDGITCTVVTIGIKQISSEIPSSFILNQNYPNPFNPITKISFSVAKRDIIILSVFDATGKEVASLVSEELNPGIYETDFDGSEYSSGVYYYRLSSTDFSVTKKMLLVK